MQEPVLPNMEKYNYLGNSCGNQGTACHQCVDYNGVRYHLYVDYNHGDIDSLENRYLQKCYDACEQEDYRNYEECVQDCVELFWSLIRKADADRERKGKPENKDSQAKEHTIVKIGVKTRDGHLQAFEHQEQYPDEGPVENNFPSLSLFSKDEVEHITELDCGIHKVVIRGTEYCVKSVSRSGESSFIREVETLTRIRGGHPNIVSLIGVVDAGEGTIDGVVLGLISGHPLSKVTCVSTSQKEKWKLQISEAISFLHGIDVVWGDAKPSNILTDDKTDDAVLIDFGGGYTDGWVDAHLEGTTEGDIQGLHRIIKYLDNLNINK